MTTTIAQTPAEHPAPEQRNAEEASQQPAPPAPAMGNDDLVAPQPKAQAQKPVDNRPAPSTRDIAIGKWVHEHRHATDKLGGFWLYQVIRNSLAAIPYGIATAAVWLGFEKAAEGAIARNPASMTTRFARSPARDIAMIAAGFTLYRGTLKVVRYTKERLFNPNHTEDQTIAEVQNFGANLRETLKEVTPAEVASTPAAAFALGLGRRLWNPAAVLGDKAATHGVTGMFFNKFSKNAAGEVITTRGIPKGTRLQRIKNVFSKPGNYWTEAAIVAASFVPFFELGDRRYKDVQVSRGIWLNDPSSLVRKSDEQVKRELSTSTDLFAQADTEAGRDAAQKSDQSMKATAHLRPTDTPSLVHFPFRRVVPTLLGIGAYVAGKRLAYLGMGTIPENYNPKAGFFKNLGRIALIEGAATSLFWLTTSVVDKWEPWYDKNFRGIGAEPKPLTDQEIRRRYVELKEKLDAKERERQAQTQGVA